MAGRTTLVPISGAGLRDMIRGSTDEAVLGSDLVVGQTTLVIRTPARCHTSATSVTASAATTTLSTTCACPQLLHLSRECSNLLILNIPSCGCRLRCKSDCRRCQLSLADLSLHKR